MSPKSYPECWRLNRCGCWSWFITRHNQFQHVAEISQNLLLVRIKWKKGSNVGKIMVNGTTQPIVINTHQFTDWTTHIKSKNIRWEQLKSGDTETRINSLEASPNPPPLRCRWHEVSEQTCHPAEHNWVCNLWPSESLSVSSSRGELLLVTLLPGRSSTG